MAKGTYIRRFDEKRLHPTADAMRPLIFYSWTSFERAHTFSHMQIQQQKTNHRCFQTRGLQIALKSKWCALDEPTMATQTMMQSQQNDAYRTMMDWWHGASCAQSYHLYMATLKVVALNIKQKRNVPISIQRTIIGRCHHPACSLRTQLRWGEVRCLCVMQATMEQTIQLILQCGLRGMDFRLTTQIRVYLFHVESADDSTLLHDTDWWHWRQMINGLSCECSVGVDRSSCSRDFGVM